METFQLARLLKHGTGNNTSVEIDLSEIVTAQARHGNVTELARNCHGREVELNHMQLNLPRTVIVNWNTHHAYLRIGNQQARITRTFLDARVFEKTRNGNSSHKSQDSDGWNSVHSLKLSESWIQVSSLSQEHDANHDVWMMNQRLSMKIFQKRET